MSKTATSTLARQIADRIRGQVAELVADGQAADVLATDAVKIDPRNPGRFRAVLAVEEERTADNRIIAKGGTAWRTPPLPLMLMTRTDVGHDGAEIAGVIEKVFRQKGQIVGEGRFDTSFTGIEAARLVANGVLSGVSIDAGDVERELIVEEEDDEGFPTKILERMAAVTVLGATIVPFPAIGSTLIEYLPPGAKTSAETDTLGEECDDCRSEVEALTAGAPILFSSEMFANPKFATPTPITVSPDGRVFGHAAIWGTCHTGLGGCVQPPRSLSGYSHFLTGSLSLQGGGYQPVGTITLSTNHAARRIGAREAAAHYDHTGLAAAYVNVGEDEYGIWVSGVLKPGISDELATELCGASLSGDWRTLGGNLELVGILGVNVPGFPVAHTIDGVQTALVAAGYGPTRPTRSILALDEPDPTTVLRMELAELRAAVARLAEQSAPLIRARLAARFAAESEALGATGGDATV